MSDAGLDERTIPLVKIEFMNQTHREEVGLVDEINKVISVHKQGKASAEEVTRLLERWLEHTEQHFANENALMEKVGFPAIAVHMGEHQRVLSELGEIVASWKAMPMIATLETFVCRQWPEWFINHVNTMDRVTAEFAAMQGVVDKSGVV